ncbi:MAG: HGGxSTG domain-containing protein [Dongiaceae bacterium]
MTARKTPSSRAATATALALAAEAGVPDLAPAAGRGDPASGLLATLLAHELAAGHRLMMRLAGRADAFLTLASPAAETPQEWRMSLEAARLASTAGRLMERYRLGLLALARLRAPDGPGEPGEQTVRLVWGGGGRSDGNGSASGGGPAPSDGGPAPASVSTAGRGLPAEARSAKAGRLNNGNRPGDLAAVPRCGAHTRAGHPCRQPAMANGRCRLHGGKSTGPRTAAGLARSRRARLVHGARAGDLLALRSAAAHSARRLRAVACAANGVRRRSVGAGLKPAPTAIETTPLRRMKSAGHGVHRPVFISPPDTGGAAALNHGDTEAPRWRYSGTSRASPACRASGFPRGLRPRNSYRFSVPLCLCASVVQGNRAPAAVHIRPAQAPANRLQG